MEIKKTGGQENALPLRESKAAKEKPEKTETSHTSGWTEPKDTVKMPKSSRELTGLAVRKDVFDLEPFPKKEWKPGEVPLEDYRKLNQETDRIFSHLLEKLPGAGYLSEKQIANIILGLNLYGKKLLEDSYPIISQAPEGEVKEKKWSTYDDQMQFNHITRNKDLFSYLEMDQVRDLYQERRVPTGSDATGMATRLINPTNLNTAFHTLKQSVDTVLSFPATYKQEKFHKGIHFPSGLILSHIFTRSVSGEELIKGCMKAIKDDLSQVFKTGEKVNKEGFTKVKTGESDWYNYDTVPLSEI